MYADMVFIKARGENINSVLDPTAHYKRFAPEQQHISDFCSFTLILFNPFLPNVPFWSS